MHNIGTSCDEFLSLPCCSKDEAYTSYCACVETNHIEEIKELKAQVTSLKKDLEKCHEGKAILNNILSVQISPNDKGGLGFNSNKKNKSKSNKKKGQNKSRIRPRSFASSAKLKGIMLDLAH